MRHYEAYTPTRGDRARCAADEYCIAFAALVAACGGTSQPPRITTPVTPTPPGPPLNGSHTISGMIVANQGRVPIGGARLFVNGTTTVPVDATGVFRIASVPDGSLLFDLSAPGYLTHISRLAVSGSRDGVTLDLISTEPPFSLGFYRQFARNGLESPIALRALNPWTMAPSFHVRTVTDDTGEAVPPAVLEGVRRVIVNSVAELSAGRFSVAAFETGIEPRAAQSGWVTVTFFKTFPSSAIGDSTVGGNSGRIRLRSRSGERRAGARVRGQDGCGRRPRDGAQHGLLAHRRAVGRRIGLRLPVRYRAARATAGRKERVTTRP